MKWLPSPGFFVLINRPKVVQAWLPRSGFVMQTKVVLENVFAYFRGLPVPCCPQSIKEATERNFPDVLLPL